MIEYKNIRDERNSDISPMQMDHIWGKCFPETCSICISIKNKTKEKQNGNESTDQ